RGRGHRRRAGDAGPRARQRSGRASDIHVLAPMRAPSFLVSLLLVLLAPTASAQDGVVTSAVLLREAGATIAQASAVSIGLRRGISGVDGVSFVHPVDALSAPVIG